MHQQDQIALSQEEADLEEVLSLVGTGLASYDRLVAAIQHQGRAPLLRTLHHARQKARTWHPNVEPLHLVMEALMGCGLSRRESEAASGALLWLMAWVHGREGCARPESVLLLLRRTVAGWLWLIARCVEETASVAEADLWFLQRMYRLPAPADPQLLKSARLAGHVWVTAHPEHAANLEQMYRERRWASLEALPDAASREEHVLYQCAWLIGARMPPNEKDMEPR